MLGQYNKTGKYRSLVILSGLSVPDTERDQAVGGEQDLPVSVPGSSVNTNYELTVTDGVW